MDPQNPDFGTLAFTVNVGEHFFVGDSRVSLIRISGKCAVRVAVTAHKSVRVDRAEVRERRRRNKN